MRRKIIAVLSIVAVGLCLSFVSGAQRGKEMKAKNLQILPADISHESLEATMKSFSNALGVKCSYCHVPNTTNDGLDFASDDNTKKKIARRMMIMTEDINNRYFTFYQNDGVIKQVSCITCHNGKTHPEMVPAWH